MPNPPRLDALTLAAVGTLSLPVTGSGFEISSIAPAGESISLTWFGGEAPFQPQYWSSVLGGWSEMGRPVTGLTATLPAPGDAVFYRVQTLGAAGLGPHVGQLRLSEGEFADPMAKHRAKLLLDFHEPLDPLPDSTPATYFRSLIARLQSVGDGRIDTTVGPIESLPDGAATVEPKKLTFSWSRGEGTALREFTLVLDFSYAGYDIHRPRATKPQISDPTYDLTIDHATPQVVIDFGGVSTTRRDEVIVYEIAPTGDFVRNMRVTKGAVTMVAQFRIGVPNQQGNPAFIFKTPVLTRWERATVLTGLTAEPISLASRFSQTYHPGHHNFVETLFFEPTLEPGIDPATLAELREANVRIVVVENPTAFPELSPSIRIFGFDGTLREL